jgi:hypothetical protein
MATYGDPAARITYMNCRRSLGWWPYMLLASMLGDNIYGHPMP